MARYQSFAALGTILEASLQKKRHDIDKAFKALDISIQSDLLKEKIAQQKASMSNLRGYTPDVQKVKQVKEGTEKDMDKMKKLWSYNKNTQ